MGWSALSASRTTQTGSFLSRTATAVNTAASTDTGTIAAASAWTGAIEGQAFAIIRSGAVVAVRCIQSFSTTTLTYYRLYLDDGTELPTDVQVGDTITLYEQPQLVGAGTALGSVAGITLTTTGSVGNLVYRQYAVGNNALTVGGFFQLPPMHPLVFGATAPTQPIRVDAGGRLALGSYRTRGGVSVFSTDTLWRMTNQEGSPTVPSSLLLNAGTARLDWFGGEEESGGALGDVAGATTRIYSRSASTRGLDFPAGTEPYQWRISSTDFVTYGVTMSNRVTVLIAAASLGGYSPRQQEIAISFSGATPSDTFIQITNPALRGGNVVDVAFWSNKWARVINNATGTNVVVGGNRPEANTSNRGLHEYRAQTSFNIRSVSGAGVSGRVFCRDRNNGSRLAANIIGANPSYASDRTYEASLVGGAASFTSDGGVLLGVAYQNTAGVAAARFDSIVWDYRGLDNSNTDRMSFALAAYGFEPATTIAVLKGQGGVSVGYTMLTDSGVTASAAVAATYSDRFTIASNGNITVTAAATLDNLYDYAQVWLQASGANMEAAGLGQKLVGFSGSALVTAKTLTVNAGVTLSEGAKFKSFVTTATVTNNGTINGIYSSSAGTSAQLNLIIIPLGSKIIVIDNAGNVIDYVTSSGASYTLNIPPGTTGTWKWVVKAPGYEHAKGTFIPSVDAQTTVSPTLVKKVNPDGSDMYQGTTSSLVSVSFSALTTAFIDIGNGTAPLQAVFDESEDALCTQAGMGWLAANRDDLSQFNSAGGDFLFLTSGWRLRRASPGDTNATIQAFVQSVDGQPVDESNGPVRFLASDSPTAIAAAVRVELAAELARIDVALSSRASQTSVNTLASTNQTEHDATQAAIAALPAPLNSAQTQAAAAAALVAYDAVVPADLAGLATSANVTAAQTAIIAEVDAIPTNPLLTNDARLNNLDAAISTRLATVGYTAPDNTGIAAIKAKTDQFAFTSGNVHSIAQVVADKTGYNLTTSERQAIATAVEQAILNENDGQAILNAIVGAIGNQNIDQIALVAAIRADIERTGGMLDAVPTLAEIEGSTILAKQSGFTGLATSANVTAAQTAIIAEVNANETKIDAVQALITALPAPVSAAAIADAVWDEHLTGATHNIANSAGRRLRQLADTVILKDGVGSNMANSGGVGYITLDPASTTQCIHQAIRVGDMVRFIRAFDPATKVATLDAQWCTITAGDVDYTLFNLRESTEGLTAQEVWEYTTRTLNKALFT